VAANLPTDPAAIKRKKTRERVQKCRARQKEDGPAKKDGATTNISSIKKSGNITT